MTRHTTRLDELSAVTEGPRAPLVARWSAFPPKVTETRYRRVKSFDLMGDKIAAADAAGPRRNRFRAIQHGTCAIERQRTGNSGSSPHAAVLHRQPGGEKAVDTSDREQQTATMVSWGRTNRQIAEDLVMSVRTVEGHVYRACTKLGLEK